MKKKEMLSPRQISENFKISYQTVNSYTNLGLLIVRRREGNTRLYDAAEIKQKLKKIEELKNKGYPLRLIREMLE